MLAEEGHQLQDPGGEKRLLDADGTDDRGAEREMGMVMEMGVNETTESDPLQPTRRQRKLNKAKALKEAHEVCYSIVI